MFTHKFLLIALAIMYLVLYLPALLNPKRFSKAMKNLLGDENTVRIIGAIMLVISMIFLSAQYKFSSDWATIIPIIGWLLFIKGVTFVWWPKMTKKVWKKMGNETTVSLISLLAIVIAVALCYVAKELLPGYEIIAG